MTRAGGSRVICLALLAGAAACGIYGEDEDAPAPAPAPVPVVDTNRDAAVANDATTVDPPVVSDQDSGLEPADSSAPEDAGVDDAGLLRDLYVFTTSVTVSPKFDTFDPLAKADALCNSLASKPAASFQLKGKTFAAWLGTTTMTAKKRIADRAAGRRYRLTNGKVITHDAQTMSAKGLIFPIALTETEEPVFSNDQVWTGVDGLGATEANNCSNWSANTNYLGMVGIISSTMGSSWTKQMPVNCDQLHRLYCFEVP